MKKIPLTQGKYAFVDGEDFRKLSEYKWHTRKDHDTYYAARWKSEGKGEQEIMHRVIMGLKLKDGKQVDHINHNGLDNRKENLRVVGQNVNVHNARKKEGTTSKYRGVSKNPLGTKKTWWAHIKVSGKSKYLGSFYSEEEAARAYNKAAATEYGDFAYLNSI